MSELPSDAKEKEEKKKKNSLTRSGLIGIVRQLENNKVNAWKPLAQLAVRDGGHP